MRRKLMLVVMVIVGGAVAIAVVARVTTSSGVAASARADQVSGPQSVRLELVVDIPKGSESDNPDHQEIDAIGQVDLATGTGELVYDFNGLNNAAGFLGHFDTMDVIFGDGAIYIDAFHVGPAWLRIVPDDVGAGDVGRLHDILLTNPLTLPAYLDMDELNQEPEGEETTDHIAPDALAAAPAPFPAAVGNALREWEVEAIEVGLARHEAGPYRIVLSFAYRPTGVEGFIEVQATYELEPADAAPDALPPPENDTREYSDLFGPT